VSQRQLCVSQIRWSVWLRIWYGNHDGTAITQYARLNVELDAWACRPGGRYVNALLSTHEVFTQHRPETKKPLPECYPESLCRLSTWGSFPSLSVLALLVSDWSWTLAHDGVTFGVLECEWAIMQELWSHRVNPVRKVSLSLCTKTNILGSHGGLHRSVPSIGGHPHSFTSINPILQKSASFVTPQKWKCTLVWECPLVAFSDDQKGIDPF